MIMADGFGGGIFGLVAAFGVVVYQLVAHVRRSAAAAAIDVGREAGGGFDGRRVNRD